MAAVTFLDGRGLPALIEARNDLLSQRGELVVINAARCVARLLKITEPDSVIAVRTAASRCVSLGGNRRLFGLGRRGDA